MGAMLTTETSSVGVEALRSSHAESAACCTVKQVERKGDVHHIWYSTTVQVHTESHSCSVCAVSSHSTEQVEQVEQVKPHASHASQVAQIAHVSKVASERLRGRGNDKHVVGAHVRVGSSRAGVTAGYGVAVLAIVVAAPECAARAVVAESNELVRKDELLHQGAEEL